MATLPTGEDLLTVELSERFAFIPQQNNQTDRNVCNAPVHSLHALVLFTLLSPANVNKVANLTSTRSETNVIIYHRVLHSVSRFAADDRVNYLMVGIFMCVNCVPTSIL